MSKEAIKLAMVDDEGENQAVRMFLAMYGGQYGITTKQMRSHLMMAGFDGAWPEWANSETHLTKAGAQLWIRHLFALAEQPAQQEPVGVVSVEAHATHGWRVTAFELTKELPFGRHSLFASPAQRKPLSVDEIFEAIRPLYSSDKAAWLAVNHSKDEYRLIEAKHGIKEST